MALFFWAVLGVISLAFGFFLVLITNKKSDVPKSMFCAFCSSFVGGAILVGCLLFLANNRWKQCISSGEYEVEFVHVAGPNVSLGIQEQDDREVRLVPFQFPTSAFVLPIKADARKLTVVEDGGFTDLRPLS